MAALNRLASRNKNACGKPAYSGNKKFASCDKIRKWITGLKLISTCVAGVIPTNSCNTDRNKLTK
jgi:hypothetical protein